MEREAQEILLTDIRESAAAECGTEKDRAIWRQMVTSEDTRYFTAQARGGRYTIGSAELLDIDHDEGSALIRVGVHEIVSWTDELFAWGKKTCLRLMNHAFEKMKLKKRLRAPATASTGPEHFVLERKICLSLVNHAFEKLQLKKLYLHIDVYRQYEIKLYEQCGFRKSGEHLASLDGAELAHIFADARLQPMRDSLVKDGDELKLRVCELVIVNE